MFLKRFVVWLRGSREATPEAETHPHHHEAVECVAEEKSSGSVDYHALADRSDARAAALHIDPPRPGRKTYSQRYGETSNISTSDIKTQIAVRQAQGKECGVL